MTVSPPTPVTPSGSASEQRDGRALLLAAHTQPITYTPLTQIPTTGQATYFGYFYGTLANTSDGITDSLTADLELQIGFTPSGVSVGGSVENFFDASDAPISGSLTLSAGALDRTGNPNDDATFQVSAQGQLTESDGDQLDFGSLLEGDFLGARHEALGGAVFGRVEHNGIAQDFDGGFITQR